MRIYGYLRASTKEQDAERAKSELSDFAKEKNLIIAAWFIENESRATLKRPELFRLLEIAQSGDALLVEQVDRISRLTTKDWEILKTTIISKGINIVSLGLPTSHQFMQQSDEFTERMLSAINAIKRFSNFQKYFFVVHLLDLKIFLSPCASLPETQHKLNRIQYIGAP